MRFCEGELAKFVVASTTIGLLYVGNVVEIAAVGPYKKGCRITFKGKDFITKNNTDYLCVMLDHVNPITVHDWQLQKLDPPVEPASMTRKEELEV